MRLYLKPNLPKIAIRDFRTADATRLLNDINQRHGIGKKSLRHCRALLGSIFKHAERNEAHCGHNPAQNAEIPRAAAKSAPTYAYSVSDVFAMLSVLDGVAKKAVALMFFAGLRPGEARGVMWEDYDGETLHVRQSVWRTHVTSPKTLESAAPVPVAGTLREILEESRRESGFILAAPTLKKDKTERPIDLHNLAARTISPALLCCAQCGEEKEPHVDRDHDFKSLPQWRGYYAFRRGIATATASVETPVAAKSLLRHTSVLTTAQHYLKSVPQDARRAIEKIDALFSVSASEVRN
jgi:integrase